MEAWLFIPITIAAAGFQTARNGVQRGLIADIGVWGATWVRFVFAMPFAIIWLLAVWLASAAPPVTLNLWFMIACATGAAAQILATAALLVSMEKSSFAVGAAFQQARLPLAGVLGVALGDALSGQGWLGVLAASIGLGLISWPKRRGAHWASGDWSAAIYGLGAGALFAISANMFREASLAVAPDRPWLGAALTLLCVQTLQTLGLGLILLLRARAQFNAALAGWRSSVSAGFFGFAASALWFTAFGMAPAAVVQAVGVIEIPIAAWAGNRLFKERLSRRQIAGAALTILGVLLVALAR